MLTACDNAYFATTNTTPIIYTDQTENFSILYSHGYKYVMIHYTSHFSTPHQKQICKWTTLGIPTLLHHPPQCWSCTTNAQIDNETSADVEQFIATQNSSVQYILPDNHCTNAAEWAIQTWKNHFIAGLIRLPQIISHHILVQAH